MEFNNNADYWHNKLLVYLHDPFDKAFCIKEHEERAKRIIEAFGEQVPTGKEYSLADQIASSFERGTVPSYNNNPNRDGSIKFISNPLLTHPLSQEKPLKIELPLLDYERDGRKFAERINEEVCSFIKTIVNEKGGYLKEFKGNEIQFAKAKFFFTHFALRFLLSEGNIGHLGALWYKIPADTRFPDHSIWNHNALTSAIYSTLELGKNIKNVGLFVFSITPVQSFISDARRLRDFWSGSIILSWLAFEGIKWVMENLGPDHVVYPSLIDQPLVNQYLLDKWGMDNVERWKTQTREIATLPNKFLFIAPLNLSEEIASKIENSITIAWQNLKGLSLQFIGKNIGLNDKEKDILKTQFDRQFSNYWNYYWAVAKFLEKNDKGEIENLFDELVYKNQFRLLTIFEELADKVYPNRQFKGGQGTLYSVSHALAQSVLAASKGIKECDREPENGQKCSMCGEYEVVYPSDSHNVSAKEYKEKVNNFWGKMREKFRDEFRQNEKLCSVCFTKRLAYRILGESKNHILYHTFGGQDSYPSTSYMALHDFFERKKITEEKEKRDYAQMLFEKEEGFECADRDKYYAILFMDGDKMGKLINGQNMASKWRTVMHPDIIKRLENDSFFPLFYNKWQEVFNKLPKRFVTPAIHSTISEILADFSIYGVYSIIKSNHGKLIYAGGDDVCAILPVSTAMKAAKEIQEYYNSSYKIIKQDISGGLDPINNIDVLDCENTRGDKLSFGMGNGIYKEDGKEKKNISISAGILFCHHKENLKNMLRIGHELLDDKAKKASGRNSCAIALRKRAGSTHYFVRKWDDGVWNDFGEIIDDFSRLGDDSLARSFVYKLRQFKDGIDAILRQDNRDELLLHFLISQLKRSGIKEKLLKSMASRLSKILVNPNSGEFEIDGLIISSFLAKGEKE